MDWSAAWVWDGGTVPVMILAFFLSAIIGVEREWWSHACGIRPCILVATGAAAFGDLIISRVPNSNWGNAFGAIATGIGFLGAGAILKEDRRREVHGLSSAATIWVVAIIGLLIGARNIETAVALTVLVLLVNVLFRPLAATIARRAEQHRTPTTYLTAKAPQKAEVRELVLVVGTGRRRCFLFPFQRPTTSWFGVPGLSRIS